MLMRILTLIILTMYLSFEGANAQELKRNTFYFEAGGASLFYSINYDRLLKNNDERNIAIRMGVMYLNMFNDNQRVFKGIPLGISYLERIKKNFIEFGISVSAISDTYYPDFSYSFGNSGISSELTNDLVLMGSLRIGIRHQPSDSRFFWNALFQNSFLIVGEMDDFSAPFEESYLPFVSFGAGYSF